MTFSLKGKHSLEDLCYMYRVNLHHIKWYVHNYLQARVTCYAVILQGSTYIVKGKPIFKYLALVCIRCRHIFN